MSAPFGRRLCRVLDSRPSGGYRILSLLDAAGPQPLPGQFYMLAAERRWGERAGRPFLPRALSVAAVAPVEGGTRLDFLLDPIGPGTEALCAAARGESVWLTGPLGNSFTHPSELHQLAHPRDREPDAERGGEEGERERPRFAGAVLVGGGVGVAPLALWRRSLVERGVPLRVLLGFRDREHSGGIDLFCGSDARLCPEVRLASEDGHAGHRGYVTDLLAALLAGDDAASAVVYACGPPAMLEAVASLCDAHGVAHELADESPMACGFGACFGCAVPSPDGDGYVRLCVDGPVRSRPAGPVVEGDPPPPAGADASSGAVPPSTPPTGSDRGEGRPAHVGAAAPEPAGQVSESPLGGSEGAATGPAGLSSSGPAEGEGLESNSVRFCGIELKHPVINASGTYDAIAARQAFGVALLEDFPFAAFVSKTITPEPRAGNEPRRIWETPAGMINSIGLPNKGLEGFLAQDLPRLAELPVPLIVSVMATDRDGFARLVAAVAAREEVAAIELNVSCPNVHSGLIVGERPEETLALLRALRPLTAKPLIVKLTPNVADPAAVAVAAEEGGADALSLINTLKASAIDPATGEPALAAGHGGLSGPAVRPIALQQLRAVRAAVTLPLIGMGGIASGADAAEFLAAGASLVAVGTESFRDPRAGSRVAAELAAADPRRRAGDPALNLD